MVAVVGCSDCVYMSAQRCFLATMPLTVPVFYLLLHESNMKFELKVAYPGYGVTE